MLEYPIVYCDDCGRNLGDHYTRDVALYSETVIVDPDGSELCGDCFEKRHGFENFEIEYTPPRLAIEDLIDDELMDDAPIESTDIPHQLDLF